MTNLKSDCSRPHSYPGEQRQDLLDGCRHVYLDMGTNAGVHTKNLIYHIDFYHYSNDFDIDLFVTGPDT